MDLWDFYIFSRSHRDDLVGQTIQNHKKTPTFTQWIGLLGKIYTGNHRFSHQITWGLNRFQFSKTNPLTYHILFGGKMGIHQLSFGVPKFGSQDLSLDRRP